MARDDHAIVVGISRYPGLGDLAGPENDAGEFTRWLLSPTGGDVPGEHVRTIVSSDYPAPPDPHTAEPTVAAVQECLDGYQNPVAAEVMDFQIGLAVKEASDLEFVPEIFRGKR